MKQANAAIFHFGSDLFFPRFIFPSVSNARFMTRRVGLTDDYEWVRIWNDLQAVRHKILSWCVFEGRRGTVAQAGRAFDVIRTDTSHDNATF